MSETATAVRKEPKAASAAGSKAIQPRDPFERADNIYEQIARRAFEIFQGNGGIAGGDVDDWLKAEAQILYPLQLEVKKTDAGVSVEAKVPGFEAENLAVGLEGRRLTITGKRESKMERKDEKGAYEEQTSDEIFRAIALPVDVDPDKATATVKNGILRLQMPKTNKPKAARVRVKVA